MWRPLSERWELKGPSSDWSIVTGRLSNGSREGFGSKAEKENSGLHFDGGLRDRESRREQSITVQSR